MGPVKRGMDLAADLEVETIASPRYGIATPFGYQTETFGAARLRARRTVP